MTHPMRIACASLAVVACVSCQPPEADTPTRAITAQPVVGRLQLHDRVLDLTVDSFGTGPNAVPSHAYAKVMADVAQSKPESENERADVVRPRMPNSDR
jgi:hypothetical protein